MSSYARDSRLSRLTNSIARLNDEEISQLIQFCEDELDAREADLSDPHFSTY